MPKFYIPSFNEEKAKFLAYREIKYKIVNDEAEIEISVELMNKEARDILGLDAKQNIFSEEQLDFIKKHIKNVTIYPSLKDPSKTIIVFEKSEQNNQIIRILEQWKSGSQAQQEASLLTRFKAAVQEVKSVKSEPKESRLPLVVCDKDWEKDFKKAGFKDIILNEGDASETNYMVAIKGFATRIISELKKKGYSSDSKISIILNVHGIRGYVSLISGSQLGTSPAQIMDTLKKEFKDKKIVLDVFSCEGGEKEELEKYKLYPIKDAVIILNSGGKPIPADIARSISPQDYVAKNQVAKTTYELIIDKIIRPQDTVKVVIYDKNEKCHQIKFSGPKPQSAKDLSDEGLRAHLIMQIDSFAAWYKNVYRDTNLKTFFDYVEKTKEEIASINCAALRQQYLRIDLHHSQYKYWPFYREAKVDLHSHNDRESSILCEVFRSNKVSTAFVKELVDEYSLDVNERTPQGNSILSLAIAKISMQQADIEIVEFLKDRGATIDAANNEEIFAALCRMDEKTAVEILKMLDGIKGFNINHPQKDMPFITMIMMSEKKLLLKEALNFTDKIKCGIRFNPLKIAIDQKLSEIASILIASKKIDLFEKCGEGFNFQNFLFYAISKLDDNADGVKVVKNILEAEPSIINVCSRKEFNIFIFAAFHGKIKIAKLLLEKNPEFANNIEYVKELIMEDKASTKGIDEISRFSDELKKRKTEALKAEAVAAEPAKMATLKTYKIPLFTDEKAKYIADNLAKEGVKILQVVGESDFTQTAEISSAIALTKEHRAALGLSAKALTAMSEEKIAFLKRHISHATFFEEPDGARRTIVTFADNEYNLSVVTQVTKWIDDERKDEEGLTANDRAVVKPKHEDEIHLQEYGKSEKLSGSVVLMKETKKLDEASETEHSSVQFP